MLPFDRNAMLTIDEMPNEDLRLVARKCGVEVANQLIIHLQGVSIHVPRRALKKATEKYIRENYDGHNVKELALACGFSVRHVYGVLNLGKNGDRKPNK